MLHFSKQHLIIHCDNQFPIIQRYMELFEDYSLMLIHDEVWEAEEKREKEIVKDDIRSLHTV